MRPGDGAQRRRRFVARLPGPVSKTQRVLFTVSNPNHLSAANPPPFRTGSHARSVASSSSSTSFQTAPSRSARAATPHLTQRQGSRAQGQAGEKRRERAEEARRALLQRLGLEGRRRQRPAVCRAIRRRCFSPEGVHFRCDTLIRCLLRRAVATSVPCRDSDCLVSDNSRARR